MKNIRINPESIYSHLIDKSPDLGLFIDKKALFIYSGERMEKELLEQIKPGAQVIVTERLREKEKERQSQFKGVVLARKHGSQSGATFTVRSIVDGVGVEKIYPIYSPNIVSVKVMSSPKKVSRSKLYYLRNVSKKKSRQKIGVAV